MLAHLVFKTESRLGSALTLEERLCETHIGTEKGLAKRLDSHQGSIVEGSEGLDVIGFWSWVEKPKAVCEVDCVLDGGSHVSQKKKEITYLQDLDGQE